MSLSNLIRVSDDGHSALAGDVDLFARAEDMKFGDLHIKVDPTTELRAIIAIHNTRLGPALGGCRCVPYPSSEQAIDDAMRLARSMSYKAAIIGLPHGGGKAVLMRPEQIADREAYFAAFGRFVDELGGRYITAVDSGTGTKDMDQPQAKTLQFFAIGSIGIWCIAVFA